MSSTPSPRSWAAPTRSCRRDRELIKRIAVHEEEAFLRTLRAGSTLLEAELASGAGPVSGDVAFQLHDTYGFNIELTEEIARERGIDVDRQGFDVAMQEQRQRAREAGRAGVAGASGAEEVAEAWSKIRFEFGPTQFLGYQQEEAEGRVLAVLASSVEASFANVDGERAPEASTLIEVFLDRTPLYAEGGGQVGDTGSITTSTGRVRVLDTTSVVEGLHASPRLPPRGIRSRRARTPSRSSTTSADASIRRNHTGTHLLHWALRQVLGDHVRQQGSLVAPDHLRFDFSHFGPMSEEEIARVEDLVNAEMLGNEPVRTHESSRQQAESAGAIAFFGDKYGEVVRVVEAGHDSVELCGGTHVGALGTIGPLQVVSEASIGSNTRRIEAVTGAASLSRLRFLERTVDSAAQRLRSHPGDLPAAVDRLIESQRALEAQLKSLRSEQLRKEADELAGRADDKGRVVARRDGLEAGELRDLAIAVRDHPGVAAAGLAGAIGDRVALVVATHKDSGIDARAAASAAAAVVGGGGGGLPELATAGGRDLSAIDEAVRKLSEALGYDPDGRSPGVGRRLERRDHERAPPEAAKLEQMRGRVIGIDLGERRDRGVGERLAGRTRESSLGDRAQRCTERSITRRSRSSSLSSLPERSSSGSPCRCRGSEDLRLELPGRGRRPRTGGRRTGPVARRAPHHDRGRPPPTAPFEREEPAGIGGGRPRPGRPRKRRQAPGLKEGPAGIDALAAAVLLQSWLDQQPSDT